MPDGARCQNCGAELLGPHCHACGQPVQGMVRHFSSLIGDFLDTVFEYDGRIWRSLAPLMVRPGHLSREYFAGRRVRYVSPFRLFFFLTVTAFLLAQLRFDAGLGAGTDGVESAFDTATTVEEVEERREAALAALQEGMAAGDAAPAGASLRLALSAAAAAIEREADRRIAELEGRAGDSQAATAGTRPSFTHRGAEWDPQTNPIRIEWLPGSANAQLNRWIERAGVNLERIREEPTLLRDAFLSSVPVTLFVLVPIFALLLKLAYLFERRFYMEHLIVVLHAHAFVSASLLVVMLAGGAGAWAGSWAWLSRPLGWLETLALLWIPLYILLAQKRIYQQGWPMTLVKFALLGVSYLVLLVIGLVVNLLFNLVAL